MRNWETQSKFDKRTDLITLLLKNRGIETKAEIEEFLNPSLKDFNAKSLGIDSAHLEKALKRIKKAIEEREQIIIFGDYDVDGITGTAILWETLNKKGASVMPYIPHRVEEGYGLSIKGIDNLLVKYPDTKLIITVDNGIVASEAVDYANKLGLEVIITDHHLLADDKPKAYASVHSTKICGSAVAWFLSSQLKNNKPDSSSVEHLELVALATVADVMKLTGFNRALVKLGLEQIRKTKRPGLVELFKLAGIDPEKIGTYELGHVIGPRINATGRIEHAMDSLRFLCTPNLPRAKEFAEKLHLTNARRQQLTIDSVVQAKSNLKGKKLKKLIFLSDKSYEPGVIGLVSGRITEEYYHPSIVISEKEGVSKASARSVAGFNIIEFIRNFSDLLVDAGGHPMAAGFSVQTKNINKLKRLMEERAEKEIDEKLLVRRQKIDCELPINLITNKLFDDIESLAPFGFGNPEPVFLARNLIIETLRLVGKDGKHLKLGIKDKASNAEFDGILFGYEKSLNLSVGDEVEVIYSISKNQWNGNTKLELKIKDIMV